MKYILNVIVTIFIFSCSKKNEIIYNKINNKNNEVNNTCDNFTISSNKVSKNCDRYDIENAPENNSIVKIKTQGSTICSGFFVHDYYVLTAAHCVFSNKEYVVESFNKKESETINVITHPLAFNSIGINFPFNKEKYLTYIGDIALVKTKLSAKEINATKIEILSEPIEANESVVIIGYGITEYKSEKELNWTLANLIDTNINNAYHSNLKLPYLRQEEYAKKIFNLYRNLDAIIAQSNLDKSLIQYKPSETVTFTYGNRTKGSCLNGDSGGPILVKKNNKYFAYALNSFGSAMFYPTNQICMGTVIKYYQNWMNSFLN
ncbi:trypsin-like serine protease [Pigmentibacter sp. JX0631]|uniref:trypsin-like serine protease n=1 Tax=Pigmentibacter sp. JX0631 TaxID=2976982 RepID=UPI002469BA16|nr:trypsin-like serine protease [Pigmentibacter sp. JX0631]WGL61508.1 trypsin-like serine protease [Pigmentibacter sp. JX0631]